MNLLPRLSAALLLVFCIIPGVVCAGEPPVPSAPTTAVAPTDAMPAPVADSDSTIVWKASERLTWDDFRARPTATDPLHALTSSDLDVQISCTDDHFRIAVQAVFRPLESWSKNRESERLLRHEQTHFDLTEVHARLLRQVLLRANLTCELARTALRPIVDAAFKRWQDEQDRYDKESNHGLDHPAQARWEADVAERLQKLPK